MTNETYKWEHIEYEVDNRDNRTTWLWIGGYGHQYIEIDPVDLVENMIENVQGYIEDPETETDVTMTELQGALQILRRV